MGDIITTVGDTAVESRSELQAAVQKYRAGDTVEFTVYRDGETLKLQLTLDEDTQERSDALDALNEEYVQSQQEQQSSSGGTPSFNWPFGWNW